MIRRWVSCAVLVGASALLLPASAHAQRGRYANTPPMTPFGPAYDPATMRQAGYNPMVYEELAAQKMMMAEQQAFLKQQQMWQKMQQQQKKNGQNPGLYGQGSLMPGDGQNLTLTPQPTRRKKRARKHPVAAVTAPAEKKAEARPKADHGKTEGKPAAGSKDAKADSSSATVKPTTEKPLASPSAIKAKP